MISAIGEKAIAVVRGNPKLSIVFMAYGLITVMERTFDGAEYYYMCAIAYSVISSISSVVAYRLKSKILFCYAMVNLFAAFINWFMAIPEGYDFFRHFYWYATINFSLILMAVELMIILDGGRDAFNFIHNQPDNHRSRSSHFKGVVEGVQ